ncbi:lysozyme g isoform X1 [Pangasianodon hypophthalmus]|uniref:lysozyme g isoform X1 n=1 Tax=Pangasianodon hypophthalmus TaxID=310915 RepID=UPI000EFEDE16|nr:lysozyme g isoform X1 [Pangasianodon hypophthalmus]
METCKGGSSATIDCIFGDLLKITTTGASVQTASQDNLTVADVEASHKMAAVDLERMNQYKTIIMKVARAKKIDPAVIAGIISRETRAGSCGSGLVDGWGDHGNAFGLMQVDKRYHCPVGAWNSEEHIIQATDILITFIKTIQQKFPNWSKEDHFKGGIAAYNAGPGNVCSLEGMDIKTTGKDYANDVVARAQWFKRNGY